MFSFYVLQISVIDVQNRDIDSNPSFFKDLEVEGILYHEILGREYFLYMVDKLELKRGNFEPGVTS